MPRISLGEFEVKVLRWLEKVKYDDLYQDVVDEVRFGWDLEV